MKPYIGLTCLFRDRGDDRWNAAMVTRVEHTGRVTLAVFGHHVCYNAIGGVAHEKEAVNAEPCWKECEIPSATGETDAASGD